MVNAADRPLSWTIAHDDSFWQTVPSSAKPNVSQVLVSGSRQIFSLKKIEVWALRAMTEHPGHSTKHGFFSLGGGGVVKMGRKRGIEGMKGGERGDRMLLIICCS